MRLADHFLAAAGTISDIGGFASHMQGAIREAQRFEVADEVAKAAGALIHSRPSTLVAALPLCRLPYDVMWLEYRGGLSSADPRAFDGAPVPWKQGVLVEAMPGSQVGFITVCWMHMVDIETATKYGDPEWLHPVNISPVAVYFDWRKDGNVHNVVRRAHRVIDNHLEKNNHETRAYYNLFREHLERKWLTDWAGDEAKVNAVFTGRTGWDGLAGIPREIEAVRELDRHMVPGISPHGVGLIAALLQAVKGNELTNLLLKWEADMQGEGGWMQCLLAMLNSRNPVVEHTPVDLTKLNKSRRKSGKAEFLPYVKTQLTMSRSQQRIAKAHGIDREAARQHLVRGHFKIRRTGVYWWAPFLRGDARKGAVERQEYEVR